MTGKLKKVNHMTDKYRKLLKIMVCEGLANNAGPGVHCELPMVYLGSAVAAVVAAYRRGDRNPALGSVLESVGGNHGKGGALIYKEIMSFLNERNCKLPLNAVVWYLIGRWDAVNENGVHFAERGRSDSCRAHAGE